MVQVRNVSWHHSLHSKMAENETSEDPNTKKIRQSISVPFIWEEKPGTPKKGWKPSAPPMSKPTIVTPPVKLIASIPFQWEEKPGKPLPCFPQSAITLPQADIISPLSPPRYSEDDDDDDNSMSCGDDRIDVFGNDEQDAMSESELEPGDFESDDSFSSAPSLLANGIMSTLTISRAIPVEQTFLNETDSGQLRSPPSPASEADSTASSYATGTTSLAGPAFLERLFPLLTPDASFPGKASSQEKSDTHTPPKLQSKDFDRESNCSVRVRGPSTLGELIMMSRRRSYQRKAVYMMKRNPSMEFMKRNAFGCFGASNGTGQLHQKWKRQFQLKIM